MLPLTTIGVLRVMPRAAAVIAEFIGPLNQAMVRWKIHTDAAIAAFLAQGAEESEELTLLEEDLNYSAEALLHEWPTRFTRELAIQCAHKPELIANHVYANRLGNGPPESGDGWTYRGRGIFQLTGKDNYRHCSIAIAGDADTLLLNPELLKASVYACESAGWFWDSKGLTELADRGGFEEITRRVTGGLTGQAQRLIYWNRAVSSLAAPAAAADRLVSR